LAALFLDFLDIACCLILEAIGKPRMLALPLRACGGKESHFRPELAVDRAPKEVPLGGNGCGDRTRSFVLPRNCRRRRPEAATERQQQRDPVNVTDAAQLDQIAFGADLVRLQVRDPQQIFASGQILRGGDAHDAGSVAQRALIQHRAFCQELVVGESGLHLAERRQHHAAITGDWLRSLSL